MHALIESPRLCFVHACTQPVKWKRKKSTDVTKRERGAAKGKEGSIKNTNSYAPSKVTNKWRNIHFYTFLERDQAGILHYLSIWFFFQFQLVYLFLNIFKIVKLK